MAESGVVRELFDAKIDGLNAKLSSMVANLKVDNTRQDEAIERLADGTTSTYQTTQLEKRVEKLESERERSRTQHSDLQYKVRVLWGIVTALSALATTLLIAYGKSLIGV